MDTSIGSSTTSGGEAHLTERRRYEDPVRDVQPDDTALARCRQHLAPIGHLAFLDHSAFAGTESGGREA